MIFSSSNVTIDLPTYSRDADPFLFAPESEMCRVNRERCGLISQARAMSERVAARHRKVGGAALDWQEIIADLNNRGCAIAKSALTLQECQSLAGMYEEDRHFRSRIVMARHGFSRGEYKYWAYPLPDTVAVLRSALYQQLFEIANRWNKIFGIDVNYPAEHQKYLARCHRAGQTKPTCLLLRYVEGDYNCLHQDVYGENVFPLQVAFLLSAPGRDFTGGDFVLTEQRPRMPSRAGGVDLRQGNGVIFAVHHRPVQGTRGPYRVKLRHGVSRLRSGHRKHDGNHLSRRKVKQDIEMMDDLLILAPRGRNGNISRRRNPLSRIGWPS